LKASQSVEVSHETIRRLLHQMNYVWKRARHVARDCDPERSSKLAQIRSAAEDLAADERLLFADEMDIHLLPKLGSEWTVRGEQREVMTPGKNQKRYLAAALDHETGRLLQVTGERKTAALFLALLKLIERKYPSERVSRIYVVVDNYKIHKAKVVEKWLAAHPRVKLLWLPSYCPEANPIERVFGDLHDKCTRNHRHKRIEALVAAIEWYIRKGGPWRYRMADIYYQPDVELEFYKLLYPVRTLAA
jgi:transposase